jgi:hypothetical protein
MFTTLGGFLIFGGFVFYFTEFKIKYLVYSLIILTIFPILLFVFFGLNGTISFISLVVLLGYVIIFLLVFNKKENLKLLFGRSSNYIFFTTILLTLYIPLALIFGLLGETYGLYYSENSLLVIINYSLGIGLSISILANLIHLEYSVMNNSKNKIKDDYSHYLGNIVQIVNNATYLLEVDLEKEEHLDKINIIKEKCQEATDTIQKIRNL